MSSERIRELNDKFRQTFVGGKTNMTRGVAALGPEMIAQIVKAVQSQTEFTEDNDPHGEHDFGVVEVAGKKLWWKIDYYDAKMEMGSDDPSDPAKTTRVLTILFPEEY